VYIVLQEIFKLLDDQMSSLRELHFYSTPEVKGDDDETSTLYFGAGDCLRHLTTLSCHSDIYPEFFNQLFQMD
jgi:hypothetical protein